MRVEGHLGNWRIADRQKIVAERGLNGWPQESAADLDEIEKIRQRLHGLSEPVILQHPLHPLKLWVSADFSPRMAYYFSLGDYEESDLELIEAFIRPGDRVVECGGGAGITGSLAAQCSNNSIVVVEPSQVMHDTILGNVELNGRSCRIVGAAVVPDHFRDEQLTLHICDEYWWTTARTDGEGDPVPVPVIRISELLTQERPTVLLIDIEGAEVGLLPSRLPSELRLIIAELHTLDIGDEATADVVNLLVNQGFKLKRIRAQTWVFQRE